MIRLLSGDLTLWVNEPNPCGRTYPRLPNGIFGRIDDMITIRGENVYPSEIDAVLNEVLEYGGEHRIIITRERAMDELLVRVEAAPGVFERGTGAVASMRRTTGQRLQKVLGLRAVIDIVPPGTFPRTDFKARRVVDDRDVFRQLSEKLAPDS